MREITGDLLKGKFRAIGHGVNCRGLMGAGIAVGFAQRYPDMLYTYRQLCVSRMLSLGQIHAWHEKDQYGFNIATQTIPGMHASIDAVHMGVYRAMKWCEREQIPELAIPRIGCGIGGLEWGFVHRALESADLKVPSVELTVVTLPSF